MFRYRLIWGLSRIFLIALLGSSAGAIAGDISAVEVGRSYMKCVSDQARRLSTGPDAADLIARAAARMCNPLFQDIVGGATPNNLAFAEQYSKQMVEAATLEILEIRAKK